MKNAIVVTVVAAVLLAGCNSVEIKQSVNPAELTIRARGILIDGADDPSPLLRAHAIEAIAQTDYRAAVHCILAGLTDRYAGVRFAACMALLEMRYEGAKTQLLEKINDDDRSVRAAAAGALHVLGDRRYTRLLRQMLFDSDVIVRRNTAMILERIGERGAILLLKHARNDDDVSVRLQVTEAMAVLGDTKAQMLMLSHCRSTYDDEVILAMLALGRAQCKEAQERITEVFEQSDDPSRLGMRLIAARALAMFDDQRGWQTAVDVLIQKAGGKPNYPPEIRKLAALTLAEIADTKSLPYLAVALEDDDPDVRIASALAVLKSVEE